MMWQAFLAWWRRRRPQQAVITIDEQGARRELPDGSVERVDWDELEAVDIVTTDEGPWFEDVFWILRAKDRGVVVPGTMGEEILARANHFPGWDTRAVILAMGSTENARFPVWRRESDLESIPGR